MDFPVELLINAIVAGLLLGGFYAAVTAGVSISFGMLDIVNIAHPAFIIVGSYLAYIINMRLGVDPIIVSLLMLPFFYALGAAVYQVYYLSFEKRGQESLRGLAFFFGVLFVTEVALILVYGVDYRYVEAVYIGPTLKFGFIDLPLRMLVPCVTALVRVRRAATFHLPHIHRAGDPGGVARSICAAIDVGQSGQHQAHRIRNFHCHGGSCGRPPHHHPAGRTLGWARIYRPGVRDLRARWPWKSAGYADRSDVARRC